MVGRLATGFNVEAGYSMAKLIPKSDHLIGTRPHGSSIAGIFYYIGSLHNGSMLEITAYLPM